MPYDLGKYQRIRVEPLTGSIGAEIFGIDVARVDEPTFAEIQQAFHEHAVIFFRDQELDARCLGTFASRFAPLTAAYGKAREGDDLVGRLHRPAEVPSSIRDLGDRWHADKGSSEEPNMGVALYCLEAPPYGGDTLFANLCAAYAALSPALKTICEPLIALHSPPVERRSVARYGAYSDNRPLQGSAKSLSGDGSAEAGGQTRVCVEHPLVCTHPDTGRPILYVTGDHMVGIKGMSELEARPLLDLLHNYAVRPEFTCRFRWRKGSLAVWDNRCAQHYAANDYAGFARTMLRAEMEGTRPIGPATLASQRL